MNAEMIVTRLRQFLLMLVVLMCVGTIVELVLSGHTKQPLQLLPIVLSIVGVTIAAVALRHPTRSALRALQALALIVALCGFVGVVAHVAGNLELANEVNAARANAVPVLTALTGHNPALAPGLMGVTGLIALAATYQHPVLVRL